MPDDVKPPDVLPLASEGPQSFAAWQSRIQAAEEKRDTHKDAWDAHIRDYLVQLGQTPATDTVVVPKHFSLIEQKKPKLFFQTPEVYCKPKREDYRDAAFLFQPVLNRYLGRYGVNAKAMMNEVTFDVLVTGLMVSKIGYENVVDGTKEVQVGVEPVPGQMPPSQPGAVLGLGPTPQPQMQPVYDDVPNVIFERYFWERVSPAKALIPDGFHGSDYDKAPWLGFEFLIDTATAQRAYNLPPDWNKGKAEDTHTLGADSATSRRTHDDQVRGWEIWYKAALFDATVKHPEQLRQLVLIEGHDQPVQHRDSPYQRTTAEGKLIGMRGFPVLIGALRYLADSAYPPSDCATTRNLVGELSKFRSTMILQRERSIPMRGYDPDRISDPDVRSKIERGEWQSMLPIPGGDQGGAIWEIARAQYPRENFTSNDYTDRDISEAWALGPNQRGVDTQESKTATELSIMRESSNERMAAEQGSVLTYFAAGAEKLGALIQLFADTEDYIEVEGPDGTKRLAAWDKTKIAGEFVYEVKPNGAQRLDAAATQKRALDLYNFAAKDPLVNRVELLKYVLTAFELDPSKVMASQPPSKGPDPANVSFRFAAVDLDPTLPTFPITLSIIEQTGFKIDPMAVKAAQAQSAMQSRIMTAAGLPQPGPAQTGPPGTAKPNTEHGGMADKTEMLNKHQEERTGGVPGLRRQGGGA